MLKYILISRIGSGCSYFKKLAEEQGLHVAKSFTTRPRIDNDDTDYIHIENSDFIDEKYLETTHNGHTYFYDYEELEKADIIPVDPENVAKLCELFPNNVYRIIEIKASNEDRLTHAVVGADDKITAEKEFLAKCEEENDSFSRFEDAVTHRNLNIANCCCAQFLRNDFTEKNDMTEFAKNLPAYFREFNRMCIIIEEMKNNDGFETELAPDGDTAYILYSTDMYGKSTREAVSLSQMAETVILDPDGMHNVVGAWLRMENTSFPAV